MLVWMEEIGVDMNKMHELEVPDEEERIILKEQLILNLITLLVKRTFWSCL